MACQLIFLQKFIFLFAVSREDVPITSVSVESGAGAPRSPILSQSSAHSGAPDITVMAPKLSELHMGTSAVEAFPVTDTLDEPDIGMMTTPSAVPPKPMFMVTNSF